MEVFHNPFINESFLKRKTYSSGIPMNKNNFIRQEASFPVLFVKEPRFQYATTMLVFPIRYAVPFNSFFQYIII